MRQIANVLSIALAACLIASAVLKFCSGYVAAIALGPTAYYSMAALECGLATGLLMHRTRVIACLGVIGVCLGGVAVGMMSGQPCGCLGSHALLSQSQHLVMASAVGALASACLAINERVAGFDRAGVSAT